MNQVNYPATALGWASAGEPEGPTALRLDARAQDGTETASAEEFRELMRHWPTGVCVITTQDADGPAGCTVSSLMSVSLSPPLLVIALATGSVTLAAISRAGAFGVNVLGEEQGDLGQRFASGEHRDRFNGVKCRYQGRLPLLPEVVACVVCTVWDTAPCADHVLVIGKPVWHAARHDLSPLLRFRSGYRHLAERPTECA